MPNWRPQSAVRLVAAGVVGLNTALRQELAENGETGIRVCIVLPRSMDTPFFEHAANYSGHEVVPIPPVFDTVNAIVALAGEPKNEVVVGKGGKAMTALNAVAPGITGKLLGLETHKVLMEMPPPAPLTPGNLHAPMAAGTDVHGDAR